jgi:hypothetical protein
MLTIEADTHLQKTCTSSGKIDAHGDAIGLFDQLVPASATFDLGEFFRTRRIHAAFFGSINYCREKGRKLTLRACRFPAAYLPL